MQVYLVNPSNVSFGIAVITPRWMFVLAAATPAKFGTPVLVDETLERMDMSQIKPATSSASACTPATPCAATRSAAPPARPAPRSSTAAFTPRCFPRRRAKVGQGHADRQRRRRPRSGDSVIDDAVAGKLQTQYDGGRVPGDAFVPRALGSAAGRQIHVGVRADRARLPEALLVLLRVAHRRPGAAHAQRRRRAAGDRRAAPRAASASSRSPTTTSIRSP